MNNAAENNTQKNNNGISQKDDRCCKLSVVVSVYNEEKALDSLFKDIIAQDYPHEKMEIVLVNAMSTTDICK